jgi:two-component system CheB/CheR fusion protein
MQEVSGEKSNGLMLVGIGASAGGVDALLRFFEKMPSDTGLAFAVVLHTRPDHESHLAEVLQTKTRMPVSQVAEAVRVERNRVYCVPPDKRVSMSDGHIRLDDHAAGENGHSAPIDLFFRELGHVYRDKAIAVVLSGAGADGSLGLGRVREEGGVSLAQDPSDAEHSSMPRNAIETGWVDFILPVASMAEKLVSLKGNAERIQLPPVERPARNFEEDALRELLALLRARTRHDFSSYKRSTLLRRIERRLQVTECEDVRAYLEHSRQHPEELHGLLRDLLISVTNFFRDPESFQRLESEIVPRLFAGKGRGDHIRVWVSGCATGEEAYTLAMLLSEYAETLASPPSLQVFATDIDEDALANGRNGVYPNTIATDVSPERLKRFFVKEGRYYRVKRELREMVLFAPHNILRDSPFSKLNLVSCRNLLIYINRNMQERVLEIFHFALKPDGYLFLGSSESAEGVSDLFVPVDKKHRIFRREHDGGVFRAAPAPPVAGRWEARARAIPRPPLAGGQAEPFSYGELHYRMLEALAPPSVLVNADHDIVHLSEHVGRYLHVSGGEPTRNLLKVAHPDLRLELRSLLITASREGGVRSSRVLVNIEGVQRSVRVSARQLDPLTAMPGFTLVVFEESDSAHATAPDEEAGGTTADAPSALMLEPIVGHLEAELARTRNHLRATVEEYETSTEELKASNEELQAINEELRAASEELETGKEELQSVNEELSTLNAELREKVEEIGRANSDLHNLMASTRIATLFLDRSLRLKLYTPSAQELFNVIPGDIGRPLAHITHHLDYATLTEEAERVLRDLSPVEREVSTTEGRYYIARLLPYRTTDDKISGVVLTFTDIHARRLAEEALRVSEEQFRRAIEDAPIPVIMHAENGEVLQISRKWAELTGYTIEDAPTFDAWLTRAYREGADAVRRNLHELFKGERRMLNVEFPVRTRGGDLRHWSFCASSSGTLSDGRRFIIGMALDITERRCAENELQRAGEELDRRVQSRTAELAEANSAMREEAVVRGRVERERLELLRRIVSTQEDERRRISRELHDQLGQSLTALRLKLEGLRAEAGKRSKLQGKIGELAEVVQRLDADVDFLAWELRPTALDDLGLIVALSNYAQEWSKNFGVEVNFHSGGLGDARLASLVESNLYRIGQEALNNVAKHAEATSVDMLLERRDDHAVLIVEDNGRGFDPEGAHTSDGGRGMGLVSMRERAALVGGSVEIESRQGEGTTVFVRTPLKYTPLEGLEEGEGRR